MPYSRFTETYFVIYKAEQNGFNGWIMLNICPQRATNPNDLDEKLNQKINKENLKYIEKIFDKYPNPTIWAAWGVSIRKRDYLFNCLKDINQITLGKNVKWITIGKRCKDGHPHHPIGLSYNCKVKKFDVEEYIDKFKHS